MYKTNFFGNSHFMAEQVTYYQIKNMSIKEDEW